MAVEMTDRMLPRRTTRNASIGGRRPVTWQRFHFGETTRNKPHCPSLPENNLLHGSNLFRCPLSTQGTQTKANPQPTMRFRRNQLLGVFFLDSLPTRFLTTVRSRDVGFFLTKNVAVLRWSTCFALWRVFSTSTQTFLE